MASILEGSCSAMWIMLSDLLALPIVPTLVLGQDTRVRAYSMYIIIAEPIFNPLMMNMEAVSETLDNGFIFT